MQYLRYIETLQTKSKKGPIEIKGIYYYEGMSLGRVFFSNDDVSQTEFSTVDNKALGATYAKNTILENALSVQLENEDRDKKRQAAIQNVLIMLKKYRRGINSY